MSISRRRFIQSGAAAAIAANIVSIREETARVLAIPQGNAHMDGRLVSPDQYSLDPAVTYLNHASIGTAPKLVQEAHNNYLALCETNPWLYMWSEPWQEPREQIREQVATLFRCQSDEVALTHNTTEVFNLLAHGLPLEKGDTVLFGSLNHAGASVCWNQRAPEKGFSVRQFEFPSLDVSTMTDDDVVAVYERQIDESTKVLVLPHIDNAVGLRHPIKKITAMARRRGVRWIAIDGAQTAGMIPLDLTDSGVDVYATSPHKWIQSPKGLGLAYISRRVQEDISPMWVTWGQRRWNGIAREFEDYGTRALPALMALGDALAFQNNISRKDREAHHVHLWQSMQELVDQNKHLDWRSPRTWSLGGALYAIEIKNKDSRAVAQNLYEEHGIVVRPFAMQDVNTLRVSPNVANGVEELERFCEIVAG